MVGRAASFSRIVSPAALLFAIAGDHAAVYIERVIVKSYLVEEPLVKFSKYVGAFSPGKLFKKPSEGSTTGYPLPSKYLFEDFINRTMAV